MKILYSKNTLEKRAFSQFLLQWYDLNGRILPWRLKKGASQEEKDPYRIWVSEIMLQQTTVKAVIPYFESFTNKWPTIFDLAEAKEETVFNVWAGLGYYSRVKNMLKCAKIIVSEHDGKFPKLAHELQLFPGIGSYTSAAISAIAFDQKSTVVDTNVERVISRMFALKVPLKKSKKEIRSLAESLTPSDRSGDYAQAIMDLGATICTNRRPICKRCPWSKMCLSLKENITHLIPIKDIPKTKPTRLGRVYIATKGQKVVLIRRPYSGLLPNMLCPPTFGWLDEKTFSGPPFEAKWVKLSTKIKHSFTHFNLNLTAYKTEIEEVPLGFKFYSITPDLIRSLPTLSKKVMKVGLNQDKPTYKSD